MFGNIFDREPIPEPSGTGSITMFAIIGVVAVVIVGRGFWFLRRKRKASSADWREIRTANMTPEVEAEEAPMWT